MKISKKQLIKLIETIYVDPSGTAIRSQDVPVSIKQKDALVSKAHPGLGVLMGSDNEADHSQGRELARALKITDYHGAEEMYLSDPEDFERRNAIGSASDHYLILFDLSCDWENSEIDENILSTTFEDIDGLSYGELMLPGEKYSTKYIFGHSHSFNNDPEGYLTNIIDHLDDEYSSYGFNRPCIHTLHSEEVIHLGIPTDTENSYLLKALVNNNNFSKKELIALRIALTNKDKNSLKKLGISDSESFIYEINLDFMANIAENRIGLTSGELVDHLRDTLSFTIDPGSVF